MNYTKKAIKYFRNPKFAGEMKNPDAEGQVGNMKCLPLGSEIQTINGFESIETLHKGMQVLSHDGLFHKISKIFVRKNKEVIINLKNRLGETQLTPEHLVKAIKVPSEVKYLRIKDKMKLKPEWCHAHELKRNDLILYPIPKTIKDVNGIVISSKKIKWDFRSKKLPCNINVNNEFLRLIGYYIAEGHVSLETTRANVSFSFGSHELEYVQDVIKLLKKLFQINAKLYSFRNCTKVMANNVHLARFFHKLCGKGCKKKKIPAFMLFLPLNKQKDLIKGMWRGDGFVNSKIPRAGYSTVSYTIASQLKFLLLRQGIISSLYIENEKTKNGVHHQTSYRLHVGSWSVRTLAKLLNEKITTKSLTNDSWADKNYFYTPITSVSNKNYSHNVYNLEVKDSHTYTTNSLLVHNCGDIMKIFLKIEKDRIKDIKFLTYGCIGAISASEAMCKLVKGKTIEEALKITHQDIINELEGMPALKVHCSVLGREALRKAIENYQKKQ